MSQGFEEVLQLHDAYLLEEKRLYLNYAAQLNCLSTQALRSDFKEQFLTSCIKDVAGEIVRTYFPITDAYVTVDQLFLRTIKFTYQDEYDPLAGQETLRKEVYQQSELAGIYEFVNQQDFISKLNLERGIYDGDKKVKLSDYRKSKIVNPADGTVTDELTDRERPDQVPQGGRTTASLEGDHKIPISQAKVNEEFVNNISAYSEEIDRVYGDRKNIWFIGEKTNNLKGDLTDPDEIIKKLENATPEQKAELMKEGSLDENGKVPQAVKDKLRKECAAAKKFVDIGSDKAQLHYLDKSAVLKHGAEKTVKAVPKILIGQLLYYFIPPIYYETKCALSAAKNRSPDVTWVIERLLRAKERVIKYVLSKTKTIFENMAFNTAKQFLRTIFDIVISLLRSFLLHIVRLLKNLVIAVLDSIRIVQTPGTSKAEKADAITKLCVLTLTNTALEAAFGYMETLGAPRWLMEFTQMIVSVVVSNLVMLLLEKADLFDVHYGFKIAKLEQIFNDVETAYKSQHSQLILRAEQEVTPVMGEIVDQISSIQKKLTAKQFYAEDVFADVETINQLFHMEIDYNTEWKKFVNSPSI